MKQKDKDRIVKSVISQLEDGIDVIKACKNAGISRRSLYNWAKTPKFEGLTEQIRELTKTQHEAEAVTAEQTLFQRAIGYAYEDETWKLQENKRTGKEEMTLVQRLRKWKPGDVTALIFLLCNLAREGMTTIKWQSVYDIKIEKEKLDTLDDLIQRYFADDSSDEASKGPEKKKGKGKKKALPASVDSPTEGETLIGESEEERRIRESLSLEMSNESDLVGGDASGADAE